MKGVERQLDALVEELYTLQGELTEIQRVAERMVLGSERDPTWICEQVSAAADAFVSAVQLWVPSLVPTPRSLDELLQTIASWRPEESPRRAASSARKLFEQLKANTYASRTNPDEIPDLDDFIADLRATVASVHDALS